MLEPSISELLMWEISEQIKPSDYDKLGVRLGIDPSRVETIARDTRSTTEAIFKLLLDWHDNQTDNQVHQLQDRLNDFDIHYDFEPALSTVDVINNGASQESSQLEYIELYDIAEKFRDEKYIELGIRLDLPYNDLTKIRETYRGNISSIHYRMLESWQKDQPRSSSQVETLVKALNQSNQGHLADQVYHRQFLLKYRGESVEIPTRHCIEITVYDLEIGVIAERSIEEEAKATFQEIKTLLTKLTKSRSGPRKNGKTVDELENVRRWCVRCIQLIRKLRKHIGKERKYEMSGFKLTNDLLIRMRAYGETGLKCLQEDVTDGILGRRLVNVLISQKVLAKKGQDLFQVRIIREEKHVGTSSEMSNGLNGDGRVENNQNCHSQAASAAKYVAKERSIQGQKRHGKQESRRSYRKSKISRSEPYKS